MVSSRPQPHFIPGKDPVPILQEAGWAPGPVWTGGKSRTNRDSISDLPARSQTLYRLSYSAHKIFLIPKLNSFFNTKSPAVSIRTEDVIQKKKQRVIPWLWGVKRQPLTAETRVRSQDRDLRWTKRHWDRFVFECFRFYLSLSFRHCSMHIH